MFSCNSNHICYNHDSTYSRNNIIFRHSILYIGVNTTDSNQGRDSWRNLYSFAWRSYNRSFNRLNNSEHKFSRNIYCHLYYCRIRRMFICDSNHFGYNNDSTCSRHNIIFRHSILYISVNTTDSNQGRDSWRNLYSIARRSDNRSFNRLNNSEHKFSRNIYCHLYYCRIRRMFISDSNHFGYNNDSTCSRHNIIFRHSILYISVNTTDSNQGRDSWRNLYSIARRSDNRSFNRLNNSEHKFSRNIYYHLYDSRIRRMLISDSNHFGYNNDSTCSRHNIIFRHSILYIGVNTSDSNQGRDSWRNLYSIAWRSDDRSFNRINNSEHKFSRNIYCHLYDCRIRRMFICNSYRYGYNNHRSDSRNHIIFRRSILYISVNTSDSNEGRNSWRNLYSIAWRSDDRSFNRINN